MVVQHQPPPSGVSLEVQHPDLLLWPNASGQGWGTHLHDQFVAGRWSTEERSFLINLWELRAICLGLMYFSQSLQGMTALSYVKRQGGWGGGGGTYSEVLSQEAQHLVQWVESIDLSLVPQYYRGVPERCSGLPEP